MHEVNFGTGLIEKDARMTIRWRRAYAARLPEVAKGALRRLCTPQD